jgi:hypothetical protein
MITKKKMKKQLEKILFYTTAKSLVFFVARISAA